MSVYEKSAKKASGKEGKKENEKDKEVRQHVTQETPALRPIMGRKRSALHEAQTRFISSETN